MVSGIVDTSLRALVSVKVSATSELPRKEIVAWVDTAFNGGLVLPRRQIAELGLVQASSTDAVLANGKLAELETFVCYLDWFGNTYETQVIANDGEYALLGTMLLDGRRLEIDYAMKLVRVS